MTAWDGHAGLLRLRHRLHVWAKQDERITAAVAFGSTERTDRPADDWSDLDLLFVVEDVSAWVADLGWIDAIGPSWLRFVHEAPVPGLQVVQVLFEGGYDADLIPVDGEMLSVLQVPEVAAEVFSHGARVLLDRVGAFDGFSIGVADVPATTVATVTPPSREEFAATVATFLYQTVWATKRLRRGERWRAHDDVDDYMRDRLLRMIEWHALSRGVDDVFPESRRLERWVPADVAEALPATFARYDDASIASALVRGLALFRRLAREVADGWGFEYPDVADAAIESWLLDRLDEVGLSG